MHLTEITITSNGKYHSAELTGLKPAQLYWYQVVSINAAGALNCFQTLPSPEGKFLFNFGIISDPHITAGHILEDDPNRLFFGKLSKYANVLLTQSILDAKKRNVAMVIFPGDLTDTADRAQYLELRNELLPNLGDIPYFMCMGNHDKFTKYGGIGERGFYKYLVKRSRGYQSIVFQDHQFLFLDSCRRNDNWGYMDDAQLQWVENTLREACDRSAFIFLHHPCNGFDVWYGLKDHGNFTSVIDRFPRVQGVFCGHMHRNKVTTDRRDTGEVPYVEVPATIQYPCSYAVVRLHEDGFEYNSYKVSRLDLSEMSRERFILKNVGRSIFTSYSFGSIGDRCFSYFNGRLHQPKLYVLSVILDHSMAVELFKQTQPLDGASLEPVKTGKTRVILGRFTSPDLALQAHQRKLSLYKVNARISEETSSDTSVDEWLLS